jgi:hypothetical protein
MRWKGLFTSLERMSYDPMVFEPNDAPVQHLQFLEWYRGQTELREEHGYNDPIVPARFLEVIRNSHVSCHDSLTCSLRKN